MQFIENINKDEYRKFSKKHPKSHFLQSYEWGLFCAKYKKQIPHYVGMKNEKKELVATALILEKKTPLGYSYGYCPRGFLIDYNNKEYVKEMTYKLKSYMKKNKYIYIKFDPDIKYQDIDSDARPINGGENNYELYDFMLKLGYKHTGFYKLYDGNQPRYTFRINLKRNWEDIEKKMSRSFLESVKRSRNYGLIFDNEKNPEEFFRLIQSNSAKDGFNAHDLDYYKILTEEFSKDNTIKYYNVYIEPKKLLKRIDDDLVKALEELKVAKKRIGDIKDRIARLSKEKALFSKVKQDKVMVCSLVCTSTNNRVWSFLQGSDDLANMCFAVQRCYYEAIKDSYDIGYEFFDLFGTPGDPHTSYKNLAKLHDFKRKFGDEYIEFIGEFDLVNKKFLYRILPILLKIYRKLKK